MVALFPKKNLRFAHGKMEFNLGKRVLSFYFVVAQRCARRWCSWHGWSPDVFFLPVAFSTVLYESSLQEGSKLKLVGLGRNFCGFWLQSVPEYGPFCHPGFGFDSVSGPVFPSSAVQFTVIQLLPVHWGISGVVECQQHSLTV